jgi:hypothetical protein
MKSGAYSTRETKLIHFKVYYWKALRHHLEKIKIVILNKSFIYKKLTFLFSLAMVNFYLSKVFGVRETFPFSLDNCKKKILHMFYGLNQHSTRTYWKLFKISKLQLHLWSWQNITQIYLSHIEWLALPQRRVEPNSKVVEALLEQESAVTRRHISRPSPGRYWLCAME